MVESSPEVVAAVLYPEEEVQLEQSFPDDLGALSSPEVVAAVLYPEEEVQLEQSFPDDLGALSSPEVVVLMVESSPEVVAAVLYPEEFVFAASAVCAAEPHASENSPVPSVV
jgi:hypothetical protein